MPLHLLVKWEVVSPNSRLGQWESTLCPIFCRGGGGGGLNGDIDTSPRVEMGGGVSF